MPTIPSLRCGIQLREHGALREIGLHILLADLIEARFLAGEFTRHLAVAQEMQRSTLADMR